MPVALTNFLKNHPEIRTIVFHLDNDNVGRKATKAICAVWPKHYHTRDEPPLMGKDYNDSLCMQGGLELTKRGKKHSERDER